MMNEVVETAERHLTPLASYEPEPFTPKPYVVPTTVELTHSLPRYGRPNNFHALLDGDTDAGKDYVVGVLIGAIIILCIAVTWFFVIVCLKIAGKKRVGFLAGRLEESNANSNKIPKSDSFENEGKGGVEVVMAQEQANEEDSGAPDPPGLDATSHKAETKLNWKFFAVRAVFVLSAMFVIVSGGLFYGKGAVAFENSLNEVRRGIDLVQNTAYKAINLTEQVLEASDNMDEEMEPTRNTVESGEQICQASDELSNSIRSVYNQLSTEVDELRNMLQGTLSSFSHDLQELVVLTEDIDNKLDSADILFYVLIAISVVIMTLISCMIVGVVFSAKGVSNCFTKFVGHAIIWPLFIFLLVLAWVFATLFLVLSLAGADFCVQPDAYVQQILFNNEDKFDSIIFGFIVYYVSGCAVTPSGDEEIRALFQQIRVVVETLHTFTMLLDNMSIERIQEVCGVQESVAIAIQSVVDLMHRSTHLADGVFIGLREVLSCGSFNPIYTTFVHDAMCVEGVNGLTWIFATTLCVSVFSMIMIMFRAALYPVKKANTSLNSKNEDEVEILQYEQNQTNNEHAIEESSPLT